MTGSKGAGGPPDYEVGYGKPPRGTQFQPGRSGNPRGRPKGRPGFRALLEKQIYHKTKIKVGGEIKSVAILEVGVMRLMHTLVQGQPEKIIAILKFLMPMLGPEAEAATPTYDYSRLTLEEIDLMISLYEKMEITDPATTR